MAAPEPHPASTAPEEHLDASPDRAWDQVLGGVLVLAVGVLWLLDDAGGLDVPWRTLVPIALVVVGLLTVVVAIRRPAGELVGIGVVLTVVVIVSALGPTRAGWGVGERSERPTTIAEVADGFGHGVGSLEVDLSDLDVTESVTVRAGVGVGEVRVVLPDGVPVEVRASAAVGEVEVLDRTSSGIGAQLDRNIEADSDDPTLHVDVSVGIGQVEVVWP